MKKSLRQATIAMTAGLIGVGCAGQGGQQIRQAEFSPPSRKAEIADKVGRISAIQTLDEARSIGSPATLTMTTRRVDSQTAGYQNNEPTILVSHNGARADQDSVTALWMEFRPVRGVMETHFGKATSNDGGRTYSQEELTVPLPPGVSAQHKPFDPMHAVDITTGNVYLGGLSRLTIPSLPTQVGLWTRRSTSGGAFSAPINIARHSNYIDKGWMAAGRMPGTIHISHVSYLSHGSRGCMLQTSQDYAETFGAPLEFDCRTGPLPRVSATNGLYVFFPDYGLTENGGYFVKSDDQGLTLGAPRLIQDFIADQNQIFSGSTAGIRVPPFVIGAIDPRNGRLYATYADITNSDGVEKDLDVLLTYSDDDGLTWSTPLVITPDPVAYADQFLPWLEIDRAGRLHLAWVDTQHHVVPDADARGYYDIYYGLSEDGGSSWQTTRLTTTSIDSALTNTNTYTPEPLPGIGDYLSIALSNHAAYVAYPGLDGSNIGMFVSRIDFPDNENLFADSFE